MRSGSMSEVNPETGYLIDMKDLKAVLNRVVVSEVDHRHLNIEVDWLSDIIPTAENLARKFFERVAPELPEGVELIHGPGCPVCVTSLELIEKALLPQVERAPRLSVFSPTVVA